MTVGADLVDWCGPLTLTEVDHDSEPLRVLSWERRFQWSFRQLRCRCPSVGKVITKAP